MKKYGTVQALRAVAANLVVIYHSILLYSHYDPSYAEVSSNFPDLGASGVQCFFVISGFVIATISQREGLAAFLLARLSRIYPIYWIYLAITVGYLAVRGVHIEGPSAISAILLLPDAASPRLSVSWSLTHELYFYVVVALIICVQAPFLLALSAWAIAILLLKANGIQPTSAPISVATHSYTLEFIAGAFVALLPFRRWGIPALGFGIIGLPYWFIYPTSQETVRVLLMGGPYVFILYGLVSLEDTGNLSATRWLQRLGDASYSTYLSHLLVLAVVCRIYSSIPHFGVAGDVIFVLVSILFANGWGLLSYRYIELPVIGFLRTQQRKRITAPTLP